MISPPPATHATGLRPAHADHEVLTACYATLDRIRLPNGLYLASPSADYSKAWLRDNVYEVLPFADKPGHHYEQTYWALLDILRRHEWKIDNIIRHKPATGDAYIHARFHPVTLREFNESWGNKQNDATGAVLFGIAEGLRHGKPMLRDSRDERLVNKLIKMLGALRYWEDADNGMWEEAEEVHASSIGACLGGLLALREQGIDVPDELIQQGRRALDRLLPMESASRRTDLAMLSLCFPYRGVVTPEQRLRIVQDVEHHLLRGRGVIRYSGDSYYSTLAEQHGRGKGREFYRGAEAEWTFGLPWLSLIWRQMGRPERADDYLRRTLREQVAPGQLPELYYARTDQPNPNTPLGWSVAMLILAMEQRGGSEDSFKSVRD
ncbi:MAG: glycoside hydrolase family 15 protein [Candidatus Thermoplasmatota archaeon]